MKHGYRADIEKLTVANAAFRKVLYTAKHSQLVLMSLKPKQDIGVETHRENDQFFRVESGQGKVIINGKKYAVRAGHAIVVPAGAKHNVINTSPTKPLRFYTVYSPPHHRDKIVRVTKVQAEKDSPEFRGKTTE